MVNGGIYQSKKLTLDLSSLKRLGIDEIALRKGHQDFVVVLVDLERNCLIGMADKRTHKAIKQVLETWGKEVLEQIEEVSIDLSGNYRGLVNKLMSEADIVADRFHVMKQVNQELNKVRNRVMRGEIEPTDGVTSEQLKEALKGSKYALLKPQERLTAKQLLKLEAVKAVSPRLTHMHRLKESFRDLFEKSETEPEATMALSAWLEQAKDVFTESVPTLCRWFGEIIAYFHHRTTSGAVEGINNKLKLIKRSGYGFTNFQRFRLRCLICWHLNFNSA